MNKVIILVFLMAIRFTSYSATITATASGGDWNSGSSWIGGVVPVSGIDEVVIPNGSTVTVLGTLNFNGIINVYGNLNIGIGFNSIGDLIMDANSSVISYSANVVSIAFRSSLTIGGITYNFITLSLFEAIAVNSGETYPLSVTDSGVVAPVTLVFFDAKSNGQTVNLMWATATEENFDYFALERSIDGEDFIEIAQIQGMGDSFKRVDYSFEDEFPLIGRSYYRLRSIDFDGYTEIFDYAMVITEGMPSDFMVYPNPISTGEFSIQTNFDLEDGTSLIIYNSIGGIERNYILNTWLGNYQLDGLRPGSYLFKIVTKEGSIVKRILVN